MSTNSLGPTNGDKQGESACPPAPTDFRLYILVRNDLPPAQRAVQAVHAATNLVMEHYDALSPSWGPYGPHLVIYALPGPQLANLLSTLPPISLGFYEPDQGSALTAAAYWGPFLPAFASLRLL